MRIDPERRVVEEHAAVDLADVDKLHHAARDRCDRGFEAERDAQIACEMVEGAERQNAERHLAAGEDRGRRTKAAVAAADNDGGEFRLPVAAEGGECAPHRLGDPAIRHRCDLGGEPDRGAGRREFCLRSFERVGRKAAALRIEHDEDFHGALIADNPDAAPAPRPAITTARSRLRFRSRSCA
jgi:hypothetical protein